MRQANSEIGTVTAADAAADRWPEARPAGVSMHLDAEQTAGFGPGADRIQCELRARLAEPDPLTIRILGLDGPEPPQAFGRVCECIARAIAASGAEPASITLAVDAHDILPAEAWSLRLDSLGRGPLYFIGTEARLESDDVLRRLWALRAERMIGAAFWPLVSSPTPLLDNEVAADLVPAPALQAPAGTAWVWVRVDVSSCIEDGAPRNARLDTALQHALAAADAAHARCRWPTAAARHDAWLNRRVAVELVGIGEWVSGCGLSPRKLSTLAAVDALLARASRTLTKLSRRMTAGNTLPAIEARDPCRRLADDPACDAWRERWRFAVERAGLAHRNLMAVSPWSLFDRTADVHAFNLIPALRHADACTFRRRVSVDHWSVDAYREFHRRAWAVMRQNARPSLVAEEL